MVSPLAELTAAGGRDEHRLMAVQELTGETLPDSTEPDHFPEEEIVRWVRPQSWLGWVRAARENRPD